MRDNGFVPALEAERSWQTDDLISELSNYHDNLELARESIAELELALEDEGWRRLGLEGEREFSRVGLDKIISLARVMYLKNPLIQGGVETRAYYIWGQGVSIKSSDDAVNEVVQAFLDDKGNRKEFTSHAAQVLTEIQLQSEANIFFVLATNKLSGRVKLRSLPVNEIRDIVTNPEDKNEVWYYVREWTEEKFDLDTGRRNTKPRKAYYPDINYRPKKQPKTIAGKEVKWAQPIYHVKVGGFKDMRFGVPETYAALDWAMAYKRFLEDWASLVRSISRFAWKVTKKKKRQVSKTKERLETTVSRESDERNPAPTTAAYWIEDENTNLQPINKSGATTSAADGKMLRLMVAATLHLPDTILSNDPQQGALATAKTLDRPTELAMTDRQMLWKDVIRDLLTYVLLQHIKGSRNKLPATVDVDDDGNEIILMRDDADLTIDVDFPPVVERDLGDYITALTLAYSMDNKTDAGIAPKSFFRRLVLSSLGAQDIDEVIAEMEEELPPEGEEEGESFRLTQEDLRNFVESLKEIKKELVPA